MNNLQGKCSESSALIHGDLMSILEDHFINTLQDAPPRRWDSGWEHIVPENAQDNAQDIYQHLSSGTNATTSISYPHGHYAVPFVLAAVVYLCFQPLLCHCIRHWILRYARFCHHFGNWHGPPPVSAPPPLCPNTDHSDLEETRILLLEHWHHFARMFVVGLLLCCFLPGAGTWRAFADYALQLLVATAVLPFVLALVVPLRLSVGPLRFWAGLARSLWTGLCRVPRLVVACIPFRTLLAVAAAVLSWQAVGPYAVEALLQQLSRVLWWACSAMEHAALQMEIQALAVEDLTYRWTL